MSKLLRYFVLTLVVSGCGAQTEDSDIKAAIDDNKPDTHEFDRLAQQVFASAATQIAGVIYEALGNAQQPVGAPGYRMAAAVTTGDVLPVDFSQTVDGGGTVTVTGTLVTKVETDHVTTKTSYANTVTLAAVYTDLTVTSVNGQGEQETVTVSGEEDIEGTVSGTFYSAGDTDPTTLVEWHSVGSFTLDGTEVPYDVTMRLDGKTQEFSGTVNGSEVSSSVPASYVIPPAEKPLLQPEPVEEPKPVVEYHACVASDRCTQFNGANFSPWSSTYCASGETPATSCNVNDYGASCTIAAGSPDEKIIYYYMSQIDFGKDCSSKGGTYEIL